MKGWKKKPWNVKSGTENLAGRPGDEEEGPGKKEERPSEEKWEERGCEKVSLLFSFLPSPGVDLGSISLPSSTP